jgi:hypothetical protein
MRFMYFTSVMGFQYLHVYYILQSVSDAMSGLDFWILPLLQ